MILSHRAALKKPSFCKIKKRQVSFNEELSFYIQSFLKDSEMPELTDLTTSNEFTTIEDLSDSSLSSEDDDEIPLVEV